MILFTCLPFHMRFQALKLIHVELSRDSLEFYILEKYIGTYSGFLEARLLILYLIYYCDCRYCRISSLKRKIFIFVACFHIPVFVIPSWRYLVILRYYNYSFFEIAVSVIRDIFTVTLHVLSTSITSSLFQLIGSIPIGIHKNIGWHRNKNRYIYV